MQNIEKLIYNLRHLRQLDTLLMQKEMKAQSAHFPHLIMIQHITKKGPVAISRIKDMYHVSAPAATQLINALEKGAYIERIKDPNDKRSSLIQLSDHGKEVLKKGSVAFEIGLKELADYLGPEDSELFNRILDRIVAYCHLGLDEGEINHEKE